MSFKLSTQLLGKIILWTILWGFLATLSMPLMAETNNNKRSSKSISFVKSDTPDKTARDQQLKQSDIDIMEPLDKQGFRVESTIKALHNTSNTSVNYGEITLYDAATALISDFDQDGFYHRFSVTIDADTVYDTSYIYAKLYLSYEGGPWNLYATSNNHHIQSDSELDSFVIETELADGFPPGYYDIRIELYNADYNEWLLSYGPYDDTSLSALPLEDSYYDDSATAFPVQTNIVVAGHAGSMSVLALVLPAMIILIRLFSTNKNTKKYI